MAESQDETITRLARANRCVCEVDYCLDDECPACRSLDPELDCLLRLLEVSDD